MIPELRQELFDNKKKLTELGAFLKIEDKKKKVGQLELQSGDSGLWHNPKEAQRVLSELKTLEREIKQYEGLWAEVDDLLLLLENTSEGDLKELGELRNEIKKLSQKISDLELTTFLSGPYDKGNAILTITAGAGGTDAQDWAQILLRMFSRWAESHGYKTEIPEISYGEAGPKSATLLISGDYAYGYAKNENGVHRLVRISPFSATGKRHTSFAAVEVIPEIPTETEVKVDPKDLKIETFRSSGPGGQHMQKTESAVRITHLPTGITAQSQSDRSQHANRETAMKILLSRLYEQMMAEHKEKIEV